MADEPMVTIELPLGAARLVQEAVLNDWIRVRKAASKMGSPTLEEYKRYLSDAADRIADAIRRVAR